MEASDRGYRNVFFHSINSSSKRSEIKLSSNVIDNRDHQKCQDRKKQGKLLEPVHVIDGTFIGGHIKHRQISIFQSLVYNKIIAVTSFFMTESSSGLRESFVSPKNFSLFIGIPLLEKYMRKPGSKEEISD